MSIHPCIECDDEVRPRQQALQRDDYGRSYGLSDHMIDFCVVKVFTALLETKKKFLKLTKRPWVRNDYIPNEQRFIFLFETENASLLLLETNQAFRIFTQTYLNSDHTIDFCVVKVFMVL